MRQIAIIGSGPAGYYTAEAAQKKFGDDVRIDIIDRLPVPFGLIRFRRCARSPVNKGSIEPV